MALDAQPAQAVPREIPMADRISALEAALQDVHQRAVNVGENYRDARMQQLMWRDRVAGSAQPDASDPSEITERMREADAAVDQLVRERDGLLREWDDLNIGWDIPHHGFARGTHMRDVFEIQRPTPLPFSERLERLQARFSLLAQDAVMLHAQHVADPAAVAHRREAIYTSILQARQDLLREWDAGSGTGAEVPPHGVAPEVDGYFERFERVDRDRMRAIRDHS